MFWRDPMYKPVTKICDEAWYEFMRAAVILRYMHFNNKPKKKDFLVPEKYEDALVEWENKEPTIYSVFNKLRQDIHDELPYSRKFIAMIDKEVEREMVRERKANRNIAELPKGV